MSRMKNKLHDRHAKKSNSADIHEKSHSNMSISTRLFLSVMGLILGFIITIIFVDARLMNGVYIFSTAWNLWDLSDTMNEMYENGDSDDSLKNQIAEIEKKYSVFMEVFDTNERMIYSSNSKDNSYGPDIDQLLVREYEVVASSDIGTNRHFEIQRDLDASYNMEYIVYVAGLDNGNLIKAYKMKTPMDEGAQITIQMLVYTSIGLFFIAAIMIRSFSLRFTRPLRSINAITHNMARLDFSKKCPPSNTREISMLADSINNMSESLNEALEDLKQKNKKLMDDYEKEKTLDQLRYEFISGVSHELKTPIAIIQGYAEGMEMFADADPETAKQYARVIIDESGRMHTLVMKLLEIIKYDSGDYVINRDRFDVHDLVQDWFTRNTNLLSDKEISYQNEIPKGLFGFGDAVLLGSVVNNYLSNGVSHVDDNKLLKAWCEDMGDVYRISIFNTGNKIETRDIDKIWSSFYRADKSLSRAEGRFGLGLAIVSSIQRLHARDFGVENMEDGVRFWFDIDKAESPTGI